MHRNKHALRLTGKFAFQRTVPSFSILEMMPALAFIAPSGQISWQQKQEMQGVHFL